MSRKLYLKDVNIKNNIFFRVPSEIGFFSVDGEGNFRNDNHQMKWIYKPPSSWDARLNPGSDWDLSAGYSQVIKRDYVVKKKMVHMLKWILHHQEKIHCAFLSPKSNDRKIDFVCTRGLLTKICATHYDTSNDWSFCASKFKSVIYLCSFETDRKLFERENETERNKLMNSWGAKFEQYMTSVTPNSKPNTSIPVNENEGYYIVLKGQINGYTLLYSAEVDGKNPDIPQNHLSWNNDFKFTDCYIELKTARHGADRKSYYNQKLLQWWLQSFLVGIPKIICGVRDENGMIEELKTYDVESIPDIARSKHLHTWNKEECLKICHEILHFVKQCVEEDNSENVYKFVYEPKPGNVVICEKLADPGEYKILPEWFTSECLMPNDLTSNIT